MKMKEDENRRLNQALEDAVQGLQKAPTQEQLAHTLTVVRRVIAGRRAVDRRRRDNARRVRSAAPQNRADRRRRALVVCLHLV